MVVCVLCLLLLCRLFVFLFIFVRLCFACSPIDVFVSFDVVFVCCVRCQLLPLTYLQVAFVLFRFLVLVQFVGLVPFHVWLALFLFPVVLLFPCLFGLPRDRWGAFSAVLGSVL